MDRAHTKSNADPYDPIGDEIRPTRLQCACISRDAHEMLRNHLRVADAASTQLQQLLHPNDNENNITTAKDVRARQTKIMELLTAVQKAQTEIKDNIRTRCDDRKTFARQVVDQIKRHAINVPPNRAPMVVTPHKVGTVPQTKPSKEAFLRRNAAPILPVVKIGGLAELEEPQMIDEAGNFTQTDA